MMNMESIPVFSVSSLREVAAVTMFVAAASSLNAPDSINSSTSLRVLWFEAWNLWVRVSTFLASYPALR